MRTLTLLLGMLLLVAVRKKKTPVTTILFSEPIMENVGESNV